MAAMKDDTDRQLEAGLFARVAAGEVDAMRAVYTAHAEAVRRFARSRLRDEMEPHDIVHETMLAVWRSAGSFEGRSSARTWILTLARNKIADHLRKASRVSLAEPDETVASDAPDAASVMAASQDAERLRACVGALPERQRAMVHLAFFEELSYREIARIESVAEGTVKSRIHHAKQLLMRCLSRA